MKKAFLILLLIVTKAVSSCECPTLSPISKEACETYDVIFSGNIDSVSACGTEGQAIAYFTINELYKGTITQQLKVSFDCSSECLMSFAKGETWLMYATYKRFDFLTVTICGHSRKQFAVESEDFYAMAAQRTFEEEKQFLKTTLGTQEYMKTIVPLQQLMDVSERNVQPSGTGKLVLLVISLAVMVAVYYLIRKKNDK
jgi:hypothetical protein